MSLLCYPPGFAHGARDGSARAWLRGWVRCNAVQMAAMGLAFLAGPVATPALLWLTLVLDLPLVLIIGLLVVMVLVSNGLSHLIIRVCALNGSAGFGHNTDNADNAAA